MPTQPARPPAYWALCALSLALIVVAVIYMTRGNWFLAAFLGFAAALDAHWAGHVGRRSRP